MKTREIAVIVLTSLPLAGALPPFGAAQTLGAAEAEQPMLNDMVGTWDVEQQMSGGPGAEPTDLPPAVAERRLATGGGFIEEVMTPTSPGGGEPFTRTAHINYNAVSGLFEYFSIDTRLPQQMHYQSQTTEAQFSGLLRFQGGTFIAPQWGDQKNAAFAYRVELSPVEGNEQTLSLFLRPLATGPQQEFPAFVYTYTRRP